jgi:hypothetical protein
MPRVDDATAAGYREAWEGWQKQLGHLHRVFLEDEAIKPEQIKGLLNREARAFEKYMDARLRLLGIETGIEEPADGGNPFRS